MDDMESCILQVLGILLKGSLPIVLNEDQIPQLCEIGATCIHQLGALLHTTQIRTMIYVDFGAGTTWPGGTHFPEVVGAAKGQDSRGGKTAMEEYLI